MFDYEVSNRPPSVRKSRLIDLAALQQTFDAEPDAYVWVRDLSRKQGNTLVAQLSRIVGGYRTSNLVAESGKVDDEGTPCRDVCIWRRTDET